MESRIAQEIKLRYQPVAVLFSNAKPAGAAQFKPGTRGCVASMMSAAAKGQTAVFDRQTFAMPWRLYREMEENVPGSFFGRAAWRKVQPRLGEPRAHVDS